MPSSPAAPSDRPRVCVFCGSGPGSSPRFGEVAEELGRALAEHGWGLVYGGGGVGLMGSVATAVAAAGAPVTGVMPRPLRERELGGHDLGEQRIVETMHERKALMHELSEAFVVLPGGLGTFEEFFEVLTWAQLGIHAKPIVVLDVEGYYAPLRALLDHAVEHGFVSAENLRLVHLAGSVAEVLERLGRAPAAS